MNEETQEETAPQFQVHFPPIPWAKPLQDALAPWVKMAPATQEKTLKELELFYSDLFYSAGRGNAPATPPKRVAALTTALGVIDVGIPKEWKAYWFNKGFLDRPEEERKKILDGIRKQREDALVYAHLPTEGAKLPDGRVVPIEELKNMVDQGLIAPNPELGRKPVEPDMSISPSGIIQSNLPTSK
jgi:hypothetical protein